MTNTEIIEAAKATLATLVGVEKDSNRVNIPVRDPADEAGEGPAFRRPRYRVRFEYTPGNGWQPAEILEDE